MSTCPRCHQPVDELAIACPFCRTELKAHGHPGIALYRATADSYLCDTCTYHADDTCNFPKRPYAKDCTLYNDQRQPQIPITYQPKPSLNHWLRRHSLWLVLGAIVAVSLILALTGR